MAIVHEGLDLASAFDHGVEQFDDTAERTGDGRVRKGHAMRVSDQPAASSARARSRSSTLMTLPLALVGSASTIRK
ncbi:unannotated protein [freshwater metagenome]|uniref:Unannotated protein n=1 Tax=freshwater metagenome TaxID=449393 RepID=A0A6J7KYC5_9ZZZZ